MMARNWGRSLGLFNALIGCVFISLGTADIAIAQPSFSPPDSPTRRSPLDAPSDETTVDILMTAEPQMLNTYWSCDRYYSENREEIQLTMQSSPFASSAEYNQPTFSLDFPETSTASAVIFGLKDNESGEFLYEQWQPDIDISQSVILPWPEDVPGLEMDQSYRWGLAVPCGPLRPDMIFNTGCITQTYAGVILHTQRRERGGASGGSGDHFLCPGDSR